MRAAPVSFAVADAAAAALAAALACGPVLLRQPLLVAALALPSSPLLHSPAAVPTRRLHAVLRLQAHLHHHRGGRCCRHPGRGGLGGHPAVPRQPAGGEATRRAACVDHTALAQQLARAAAVQGRRTRAAAQLLTPLPAARCAAATRAHLPACSAPRPSCSSAAAASSSTFPAGEQAVLRCGSIGAARAALQRSCWQPATLSRTATVALVLFPCPSQGQGGAGACVFVHRHSLVHPVLDDLLQPVPHLLIMHTPAAG